MQGCPQQKPLKARLLEKIKNTAKKSANLRTRDALEKGRCKQKGSVGPLIILGDVHKATN